MTSTEFAKTFFPLDFFVFRTALLPFDAFLQWSDGLEAPNCLDDADRLEDAVRRDWQLLRERLWSIATRPEIREALFLASPDLHDLLDRRMADSDEKKRKRLERTLVRYFARMSGRSTPFGLFAGYSIGKPAARTRLELQRQSSYQRHTRLDMDYLGALADALRKDPALRAEMVYRPNSSLYSATGRLRYAELRINDKGRSYHLVAVDETQYLEDTLRRAEKGATVAVLAAALADEDVTVEDATEYIGELVETQILVPDLELKATGAEPIHDLIAQLRRHRTAKPVADVLDEVRTELSAIDDHPPGIDAGRYKAISAKLEKLPAVVNLSKLFQVDLIKPVTTATLGDDVLEEIARAVHLLHDITPEPHEDDLSRFREAFVARWENREMPLAEVLDEESGIGFEAAEGGLAETSPLLEGLAVPVRGAGDVRVPWRRLDTLLLNKLHEAARTGKQLLELTAEELTPLRDKARKPLPDSLAAFARIAAVSQDSLDEGRFDVLVTFAAGPSGAILLGRFCHGDPELLTHVQRYLRAEEALRPDAIFAEIVHLPEGRTGNVILRPQLRSYEIPFLGSAAVPEECQIPVTDLMVSIRGATVMLRSKRLGKEILPRLTNAHNFRRSLGTYRFLCKVQQQGAANGVTWSWGALEALRYLPRVKVGRIVLARARWRVDRKELDGAIAGGESQRYRAVQVWREARDVPRFAVLVEGDNTLPIDFHNVLSVDTFVELAKKRPEMRLEELYPAPDELCATGPEGRFVHELVVPLTVKREENAVLPVVVSVPSSEEPRIFAPGSEWLYAKLYTGSAGADDVLRQVVAPLAREAMDGGQADAWFFIRYADPERHLRVRFHGDARILSSELLPRLHRACAPLLENRLLWKVQLDTYVREIERYGAGRAMQLAEMIFHLDSEAVIEILDCCSGDALADARWRLALRGMDQLLDDFGFDRDTKQRVILTSRRNFLAEMDAGPSFDHQLGNRFRREARALDALLRPTNDHSGPLASALAALNRRSQRLRPFIDQLREASAAGELLVPVETLAASFLHMHANRMLRSASRAQEAVIYDFLHRLYDSQRARTSSRARSTSLKGEG